MSAAGKCMWATYVATSAAFTWAVATRFCAAPPAAVAAAVVEVVLLEPPGCFAGWVVACPCDPDAWGGELELQAAKSAPRPRMLPTPMARRRMSIPSVRSAPGAGAPVSEMTAAASRSYTAAGESAGERLRRRA